MALGKIKCNKNAMKKVTFPLICLVKKIKHKGKNHHE